MGVDSHLAGNIDAARRASQRDELLATLLARLTDQLRSGREPDVEAVAQEHADVAAELRQLWAAVLVAEQVAGSGGGMVTLPAEPKELRSRRAAPCGVSAIMKCWTSWDAAAWAWFTRRVKRASAAMWR